MENASCITMSELSSENQVLRPAKKRHGVWRIERAFARSYSFAEFGWRRWRLWRLAAVCRLDWHEFAEDERSRGGRYHSTRKSPGKLGAENLAFGSENLAFGSAQTKFSPKEGGMLSDLRSSLTPSHFTILQREENREMAYTNHFKGI